MKKFCLLGAILLSTSIFAVNPVRKQSELVQKTMKTHLINVNVSVKKMNFAEDNIEADYYDIVCANGNTAHKAFNSLQEAWDWAIGYCQ